MGRPPKSSLPSELEDLLQAIGANLCEIRRENGISQAEMARRAKVSLTTVNEIETRQFRDVRLSTLIALASVLHVPVTRFMAATDLDLSDSDQARLLKASDTLLRITRKLRS